MRWLLLLPVALLACGENPDDLPAVGTLERDRIELVAEAQEPIVERAVREGDRVEAGDLVLRQDDERLRAQVVQAESRRDLAAAAAGRAGARPARRADRRGARGSRVRRARSRRPSAS
jgi:HlyD family secretion protein